MEFSATIHESLAIAIARQLLATRADDGERVKELPHNGDDVHRMTEH
jgi:hypothetical protein